MTVITVPKTPKSAFNPDRPAGTLLRSHIEHLEHALGLPVSKPKRRRSEGQAARYIGELTSRLMQPPAAPAEPASPAVSKAPAPRPKAPRAKAKRRSR